MSDGNEFQRSDAATGNDLQLPQQLLCESRTSTHSPHNGGMMVASTGESDRHIGTQTVTVTLAAHTVTRVVQTVHTDVHNQLWSSFKTHHRPYQHSHSNGNTIWPAVWQYYKLLFS